MPAWLPVGYFFSKVWALVQSLSFRRYTRGKAKHFDIGPKGLSVCKRLPFRPISCRPGDIQVKVERSALRLKAWDQRLFAAYTCKVPSFVHKESRDVICYEHFEIFDWHFSPSSSSLFKHKKIVKAAQLIVLHLWYDKIIIIIINKRVLKAIVHGAFLSGRMALALKKGLAVVSLVTSHGI